MATGDDNERQPTTGAALTFTTSQIFLFVTAMTCADAFYALRVAGRVS